MIYSTRHSILVLMCCAANGSAQAVEERLILFEKNTGYRSREHRLFESTTQTYLIVGYLAREVLSIPLSLSLCCALKWRPSDGFSSLAFELKNWIIIKITFNLFQTLRHWLNYLWKRHVLCVLHEWNCVLKHLANWYSLGVWILKSKLHLIWIFRHLIGVKLYPNKFFLIIIHQDHFSVSQ